MRILMLNYEYPPLGGGGGVAAANLAREFVRQGHGVDYITTHQPGFARAESIDGVEVLRVRVLGKRGLQTAGIASMLSFPPAAVQCALRRARRQPYDIVHSHFAIPSGPAGYILSKLWRKPHVLSVYGGDIYDPTKKYSPHRHVVLKQAVKRVLNQADVVVPESEDLCRRARQIYHPTTPIQRIPLGFCPPDVPAATREDLGLRDDRTYAIAVGRMVARKAYPDLLRALGQANVPELDLIIIGDGPAEQKLRNLAKDLKLKDRVIFAGHVSEDRKFQLLQAADFFALASLHEGYGIVFQEAMHCGLAIAATNEGGQTDFLIDEENALLSDPGDPRELAASLRRLAQQADLRARLGTKNREAIRKQYVDSVAAEYLRLFEKLLATRAQASTAADRT